MFKQSFSPIARADARVLVLGSLPGDRSLLELRYYAHPQNQFWRLMSPVAGVDLTRLSYERRLAALQEARIALWDVIGQARRTGSGDAAITDATANDLVGLLDTLPDLQAIAFNGATALRHGLRALGERAGGYAIVGLPSSSPLHTIGVTAKADAWSSLRAFAA